jgi:uncharacterized protein (TIGR03437 family)
VDATGPQDRPVSFSGTITFNGTPNSNGDGSFTVSGQGASIASNPLKFLTSGEYFVLSSGAVQITNPFNAAAAPTFANTDTVLFGGVGANGVIVASSTDTGFCDLLVAVPAATSASVSTLSGTYNLAHFEFLNGDTTQTRNSFFSATADGKGGFGTFVVAGTAQNLTNAATTQTASGPTTYTVNADGTGTMVIPQASGSITAARQLLAGNKILAVSQDGSMFIAGSNTGYDLIIGAKQITGNAAAAMTGLYFTAYVENIAAGSQSDGVYGSNGSSNILANSTELGHQRTNYDQFAPFSFDFTYSDDFTTPANGIVNYPGFGNFAVSAGGNLIIGAGDSTNYQAVVYVKAPQLSGSGVFLNPQGIVNAANNIPFTAAVSPGEVISLFGTNLASSTVTAPGLPFPTTLGGATVTINGTQAPIYYASPTLISAVVPYSAPSDGSLLSIVVNNGGTASNTANVYSGATQPGIFTVPAGGLGNGAILDTNFKLITPQNPAAVGQTVQIFLTGLGAVSPAVKEGTAAPSNPLSNVSSVPDVYIDNKKATVAFAGLAPTLGGLYQLNVVIPAGVTSGQSVTIEIVTDDADNIEATIPIK